MFKRRPRRRWERQNGRLMYGFPRQAWGWFGGAIGESNGKGKSDTVPKQVFLMFVLDRPCDIMRSLLLANMIRQYSPHITCETVYIFISNSKL